MAEDRTFGTGTNTGDPFDIGWAARRFERDYESAQPTAELVERLKGELRALPRADGRLPHAQIDAVIRRYGETAREEQQARALAKQIYEVFSPQQFPWPEGNRICASVVHLVFEKVIAPDGSHLMSYDDFVALVDAYFSVDETRFLAAIAPRGIAQHVDEFGYECDEDHYIIHAAAERFGWHLAAYLHSARFERSGLENAKPKPKLFCLDSARAIAAHPGVHERHADAPFVPWHESDPNWTERF